MAELKPYDVIVHIEPITPGTDGKISFQAKEAGVLVRCESCRHHVDTVRFPGDVSRVWCSVFYRDMKTDDYCSIGEMKNE